MTALLFVGGPQHGQEFNVADDRNSWVDVLSATTYYRRRIVRPITNEKGLVVFVMAHESLHPVHLQALIADVLVTRWFKEAGTEVSIEARPGAAPPPGPQRNGRSPHA